MLFPSKKKEKKCLEISFNFVKENIVLKRIYPT